MMRQDYEYTAKQNPHALRSREILKKYPEIRKLMKPYPLTSLYIILVTAIQLVTGWFIVSKDLNIWWILLLAYTVGALCNHALYVLMHDAGHDAIFKSRFWNRIWCIFTNIGQAFPSAMSFRTFHNIHHSNLNEYDHDADLAFHKEAQWVGNIWWRKALWFMFFFAVEVARPMRLKKGKVFDQWMLFNILLVIATDVAIYMLIGPWALWYLMISTLFSVGLHPVGARWIQEHYTYREGQETYGYYGPMNYLQFNIGYHNEHHDFYRVPWVHLPKIRAMAPEYYNNLYYHTSWTKLILDFIFNPERNLYLRIVRNRKASDRKAGSKADHVSQGTSPSFGK